MLPAMRSLVLFVALAGCTSRNLEQTGGGQDLGGGGGSSDLAGFDFAGSDLAGSLHDLARPIDLAGSDLSGDACTIAGGYCAMGDFVPPMCKTGTHEDTTITMTGVCGLGICCLPDKPDCRTTGCSTGSHCDGCLGANGVEYVCIGDGSAC
jgi:hypothetical protein